MGVTDQHEVLMFGQYTHAPAQVVCLYHFTGLLYTKAEGRRFWDGGDKGYLIDTSINW